MNRYLNDNVGIVTSIDKDMTIALRRGGNIRAPITEGITVGDTVTFLTDALERKVECVMLKKNADDVVNRGSNHLFDTVDRDPHHISEEDTYEYTDWNDETIFGCADI